MSRVPAKAATLAVLLGVGFSGCADEDACKGRSETCLSLTLSGEGVMEADQLEVLVVRQPKPQTPMMPLGEPKPLPFKVAVLWPDGPGTVSVRSYLQGTLNGVTPELALDLRNGEHDRRKLTLYPPLAGIPQDFGTVERRDMKKPMDLSMPDLSMPDLSPPPPDMTGSSDMSDDM
jgi:hypothetical protein